MRIKCIIIEYNIYNNKYNLNVDIEQETYNGKQSKYIIIIFWFHIITYSSHFRSSYMFYEVIFMSIICFVFIQ